MNNNIAHLLKIFGVIIIIVGIVLGFVINNPLIYGLSAGVAGLLMIGLSEVIELLQDIVNKLYTLEAKD